MKNKNFSLWAEDFDYENLSEEANKYNLSLGLLEDAREVLTRCTNKKIRGAKSIKHKRECWQ